MTDLDRLEEITERARKDFLFAEAIMEKLENIDGKHERGDDFFLACMVRWNAENLMEVTAQLRQLREIVREAGEVLEPFASKPTVDEILKGRGGGDFPANTTPEERIEIIAIRKERDTMNILAARALHNKIKEVMG